MIGQLSREGVPTERAALESSGSAEAKANAELGAAPDATAPSGVTSAKA
jgi:hypothetical protein